MSKIRSSNELNLNVYWFQQAEYLRGDMIRLAQEGRYVDAARSLLYFMEQLPPAEKDPEIKGWITLIRGIRARAQADASGSTRTMKKYNEDALRDQYSRDTYEEIHEKLHEKLHKAGIFVMPVEGPGFHDPSIGRRSQ